MRRPDVPRIYCASHKLLLMLLVSLISPLSAARSLFLTMHIPLPVTSAAVARITTSLERALNPPPAAVFVQLFLGEFLSFNFSSVEGEKIDDREGKYERQRFYELII